MPKCRAHASYQLPAPRSLPDLGILHAYAPWNACWWRQRSSQAMPSMCAISNFGHDDQMCVQSAVFADPQANLHIGCLTLVLPRAHHTRYPGEFRCGAPVCCVLAPCGRLLPCGMSPPAADPRCGHGLIVCFVCGMMSGLRAATMDDIQGIAGRFWDVMKDDTLPDSVMPRAFSTIVNWQTFEWKTGVRAPKCVLRCGMATVVHVAFMSPMRSTPRSRTQVGQWAPSLVRACCVCAFPPSPPCSNRFVAQPTVASHSVRDQLVRDDRVDEGPRTIQACAGDALPQLAVVLVVLGHVPGCLVCHLRRGCEQGLHVHRPCV